MRVNTITCKCGDTFDVACVEWPPKVIVCPGCSKALGLVAYDPRTTRTAYRRITDV
jgi:hypothetical protein